MIDSSNSTIQMLTNHGSVESSDMKGLKLLQGMGETGSEFEGLMDQEMHALEDLLNMNGEQLKDQLSKLSQKDAKEIIAKLQAVEGEILIARENNAKKIDDLIVKLESKSEQVVEAKNGRVIDAAMKMSKSEGESPIKQTSEEILQLRKMLNAQKSSNEIAGIGKNLNVNKPHPYKSESLSMFSNQESMANQSSPNDPQASITSLKEVLLENTSELSSEGSDSLAQMNAKNDSSNVKAFNKVFQLDQLDTSSVDKVISQIQDYIGQVKAAREPNAQMSFNHPELGDIELFVQKTGADKINVQISHQSAEAAKFFQQHQGELLQSLQNSGIQVGEFKLEANSGDLTKDFKNSEKEFAQNSKENGQRSHKDHQDQNDSQKRRELWELLANNGAAA